MQELGEEMTQQTSNQINKQPPNRYQINGNKLDNGRTYCRDRQGCNIVYDLKSQVEELKPY